MGCVIAGLSQFPDLTAKYGELLAQLAEFVVVTVVVYLVGRFVVVPVAKWLLTRRRFESTLAPAVEKFLRVGVVVVALTVGIGAAGFRGMLGGSALVVAAATLAVGFAAQNVLSNCVAGVSIVQDRSFNVDDWVEWDGRAGFTNDTGFRVTRLRSFDNEPVPNTELATTAVTTG